jgi:translocation and assembly module TamA
MALATLLGVGWSLAPPPAFADEPKAAVQGVEDRDLRARIEQAIGKVKRPPQNSYEARRRAADAAQTAILALRSEGYYGYDVQPDVVESDPPRPVVKITPGPQFRIAAPQIEWIAPPPEEKAQRAAEKALDLRAGAPGRAAEILAAEGRAVAATNKRGYADAKAGDRRVVVDHADDTVRPTIRIESGPLVRLDGVQVDTKGRTNPRWVAALSPWRTGARYDPEKVAELERRLLDTNAYDSVTVAVAPASRTTPEGFRPVVVSLSDRPKGTLELGAGWSTAEGFGLEALWNRYNRFGRADTLTTTLRLAEIERRLGVQLALPHWGRPARTLTLATSVYAQRTDAYDSEGVVLRADFRQRFGKTSFYTYGGSVEYLRTNEPVFDPRTGQTSAVLRNLAIVTLLSGLSLDRSDDPLDPKHGWRLNADLQPTVLTGDTSLTFLRAQAQVTGYWPIDTAAKSVVAGRLRLGSLLNGSIPEVPAPLRFYSGGGGSVRGYDYQGIGPRLPDGKPLGGLALTETSLEFRRQLWGKWGGVVFADGGAVNTTESPTFNDMQWGVGIGARYRLPFGPVRADIAVPLDHRHGQPSFQVYVSIGQAF